MSAAAPAAAAPPVTGAPPWFHPACQVCGKTATPGFNMKKQPCRMCIATTKQSIADYEWESTPDGKVTWRKKGEAVAVVQQPPASDGGSKTAFTSPDFVAKLKGCKTPEDVALVLSEATKALGEGSAELSVVMAAAETVLDQIIDAASGMSEKRLLEIVTALGSQSTDGSIDMLVETAASEGATPEQMAKVNDAAAKRKAWLKPIPTTVMPTTPAPVAEQPIQSIETPPKRGPGRPKGSKNAEPAAAAEPSQEGLVLVIGANVDAWPGRTVVSAESVLNGIPGYWDTIQGGAYDAQAAFRRRDAIRSAANGKEASFIKQLSGVVIVQKFRDPDVSNLMSSLMPHAQIVVTGTLL